MSGYSNKEQKKPLAVACVALALVFFAFHKVSTGLWAAWQTDEYSHGVMIPFIALMIAWHRMTERRPQVNPSWWGVGVLLVSSFMLLVGVVAAFEAASEYGFILALAGLSLAFIGSAATKTMVPALIYLAFAVPLPHLVYANLSEDLQLISSTIGVFVLDHLGIAVFQEGNIIDLGGYKLQVVEACNGLRYLFPLISFGYLVAYLFKDKLWKRAIVFVSTVPIAIIMNSLRIAFIGITVNLWGIGMAEGFVHDFEGWVVFLLCVAILMGEISILIRIGRRGHFRFEYFGLAHGAMVSGRPRLANAGIAATVVALAMAVVFGTGLIDQRPQILPVHEPLANFPTQLGAWHAKPQTITGDVLAALQLDDYWVADYSGEDNGPAINFYIAYYASQHVGSAAHSPSNCIPGGGWQVAKSSVETVGLPGGQGITLTRLLIKKGPVSQLVYYWFDERGRDITETYSAKWFMLLDSVTIQRTDGALIRLVTQLANGESEADGERRLDGFLALSYPEIKTFVPGGADSK